MELGGQGDPGLHDGNGTSTNSLQGALGWLFVVGSNFVWKAMLYEYCTHYFHHMMKLDYIRLKKENNPNSYHLLRAQCSGQQRVKFTDDLTNPLRNHMS